tara:strand:- start:368 stop:901 length:534 start_codon:yes stop_codon:yes gene_type:complete
MNEIWKTIEEELTGDFARGYALALHLEEHDIRRECKDNGVLLCYEWGDFSDCGESSPQEWRDETGYIVCTEEEADELAYEYIVDTLWAFLPSFLAGQTGIDIEVFEALNANGKCESNNAAIASLIKASEPNPNQHPLQEFVDAAIGADGREHFLAHYDAQEHEVKVGDKTFYIYRVD